MYRSTCTHKITKAFCTRDGVYKDVFLYVYVHKHRDVGSCLCLGGQEAEGALFTHRMSLNDLFLLGEGALSLE